MLAIILPISILYELMLAISVVGAAADEGDGGGDAGTTHPSRQVPREHHAQGSNIPFRYPSL